MQFHVARIILRRGLQVLDSIRKSLLAVVADSQQSTRLIIRGIGRQSEPKSSSGGLEVSYLELSQTQVQFHAWEPRIERQGLFIGRCRFRILFLLRKDDSKTGEGRGVFRIAQSHSPPGGGRFRQLSFFLQSDRIGGGRGRERGVEGKR